MDDNAKNASSYHLDQEILDARGIDMTVEEVAGLPTIKYSVRVQSLHLSDENLAFLKGLRRRIKNRLASQNSRRRSMEHLKKLTRELRAVRACRDDALAERRALLAQRDVLRDRCQRLRKHVLQTLKDRFDTTEVPQIDIEIPESQAKSKERAEAMPLLPCEKERDKSVFECRIDKLVQQSVNHIFKSDKKKIFAKTVFISDDIVKQDTKNANVRHDSLDGKCNSQSVRSESENVILCPGVKFHNSDVRSVVFDGFGGDLKGFDDGSGGVLNLSVKEGRRKSHGRKQSAPRRVACVEYEVSPDDVLDLKVKREPQ